MGMCNLVQQGDSEAAAIVVIAGLLCAAGMEAFLNFCLGCFIFGLLVKFGLIDDVVYSHSDMV